MASTTPFSDEAAARFWLLEDEYSRLDHLTEVGEVPRDLIPPNARNDKELLPLMYVKRSQTEE